MSWYRKVKTIYTAAYLMFIFICYSLAVELILKGKINYIAYIIVVSGVLLMQYIVSKDKSIILAIVLPSVLITVASYCIYPLKLAIINSIIDIVLIVFMQKIEDEEINHDVYKSRLKIALIILTAVGIGAPSLNNITAHSIFRFYILFLILAILTLREARNFSNRIRNRKSTVTNLIIITIGIISTTDYAFQSISKFYTCFLATIKYLMFKISNALAATLFKPLDGVIEYVISKWSDKHVDPEGLSGLPHTTYIGKPSSHQLAGKIISVVIYVIVVLIIVKLLINLYKRLNRIKTTNGKHIEKERIYNTESKKKKNTLANLVNRLFGKENSVRGQILYIYSKFQYRMKLKNIFRSSMTATQLSNVARVKIDDFQALDSMKNIYNEAKFSLHQLPKENAEEIKENYDRVRKYK